MRATLCPGGAGLDAVERLAGHAEVWVFRAGDRIWSQGDAPTHLTVIARGLAAVSRAGRSSPVTLGIFGPRDAVGLVAVLDGVAYPADAIAVSRRVVLVACPVAALQEAVATDTALARGLLSRLAQNTHGLRDKIAVTCAGSVDARLAALLTMLADRYGEPGPEHTVLVPIELTRRQLAEYVQARVETVIRRLAAWAREGLARSDVRGIHISDLERLRLLAGASEFR